MIQLHYFPGNASMAPHLLLEEIGQPFELKQVDRANNGHKSADYLKLNPNGLIPVLVDGETVLYEAAAILLHLADTHPAAGLLPAVGTAQRAQAYKWLVWLTNTVQPALLAYFYPERWVKEGNSDGAAEVQAQAEARVVELLAQVEAQLSQHGGNWLLGADYSAVDAMAFMLCRWTRGFTSRPARDFPLIGAYLQRMLARPAVQRMLATEQLPAPWI
ncbi:glutathione S-transferase family protein [Roseateles oligotrophus]|uniref:Glutathione S-transferase family protein n=1 Tax=Roseateles oligotrophus TaxID=1769250 RepID=A0ABT2YD34_9BURK|nr:glutathione S-transferase family protein [Roseateles oligotrophus]MCV2367958.1 glutathione S-transferase family protein [Roseateles oligotrophus]